MSELVVQVPRVTQQRATLLDLLDRVLGKGVVAYGDIVLSIADLDLVYLNLRAVLSSIGTLEKLEEIQKKDVTAAHPIAGGALEFWEGREQIKKGAECWKQTDKDSGSSTNIPRSASAYAQPSFFTETPIEPDGSKPGKLKLDPQKTAQGLAKLAMTLINLLRKLMERQAIRRMEGGTLTPEQLERAGQAFQRLDDQIKELCSQFGLKEEDLNLDLGPLGKLV